MSAPLTHQGRKGGMVWLLTALALIGIWKSEWPNWLIGAASWILVELAWMVVLGLRRELSQREMASAILSIAIAWLGAACSILLAIGLLRLNLYIGWFELRGAIFSGITGIGILFFLAAGLAVWLIFLAAVVPGAARSSGGGAFRVLSRAVSVIRLHRRSWSLLPLTVCVYIVALFPAEKYGVYVEVVAGLAAGWTGLAFLSSLPHVWPDRTLDRSDSITVRATLPCRRMILFSVAALHLIMCLFYGILLFSGFGIVELYLIGLAVGALFAAIAWLSGLLKPIYYIFLALLFICTAPLFMFVMWLLYH